MGPSEHFIHFFLHFSHLNPLAPPSRLRSVPMALSMVSTPPRALSASKESLGRSGWLNQKEERSKKLSKCLELCRNGGFCKWFWCVLIVFKHWKKSVRFGFRCLDIKSIMPTPTSSFGDPGVVALKGSNFLEPIYHSPWIEQHLAGFMSVGLVNGL